MMEGNRRNERQQSVFSSISEKHEKLKNTIHNSFRYPLPRWGRFLMGCFYCSLPIVGGYYVMQWAISRSHASIGEKGEKLLIKDIEGIGDKRIVGDKVQKVGAGGWGGGVNLAVSDPETQQRNKEMLEKFLKKQAKKKKQAEKDQNN